MSKIIVDDNPEFSADMDAFDSNSPAIYSSFNDRYSRLLNNDVALENEIKTNLASAIKPKGTIAFVDLPTSDITSGDMYNISDKFTSDTRFKDGGGTVYPQGTNVYMTSDGKWDCYAGATSTMDSLANIVSFTEASSRANIETGETHATLFGKIRKWFSSLGTAAFKDSTSSVYSGNLSLPTSGAVYSAVNTAKTASESIIGGIWDSSTAYTAGQFVIYDDKIWKCLVDNTNTTPSEGSDWTATTAGSEIKTLNDNLTNYILRSSLIKSINCWNATPETFTVNATMVNFILISVPLKGYLGYVSYNANSASSSTIIDIVGEFPSTYYSYSFSGSGWSKTLTITSIATGVSCNLIATCF